MSNGSGEIVVRSGGALEFTDDERQMIRDTFANGASDSEFKVLLAVAQARRLNPMLRQIYFVKRWDSQKRREVWSTQISIDGLRAVAERTGRYDGQDEPEYIESAGALVCCKVRVWRKDWPRPAVGVAYLSEYVQTTRDGEPTAFWKRMPHVMLAKCAEALGIRKAFPEDTAGLYVPEEMGQADNEAPRRVRGASAQVVDALAPQLSAGDERLAAAPHAPAAEPVRINAPAAEDHDEIAPDPEPPPTALDALDDALDQFDRPELDQLVSVWLEHSAAIAAFAGGDQAVIDDAMGRVCARSSRPLKVHAFNGAVEVHALRASAPAFDEFCKSITLCAAPADVVAAWRAHREQTAALPERARELAWTLAHQRVGRLDMSIKQSSEWLRAQLGDDAPKPPRGGKRPAPANDAPAAAAGDARAAAPASGAQACAEWEAHLATKPNPFAVHASLAKRAAEFRAAGVLDARTRTAMLRVQALIGTTSEMVALAVLREPSRHYAGKAA